MTQRNNKLLVFIILLITFTAAVFVYPAPFNSAIDFLNVKSAEISRNKIKFSLPHFKEVPFKLGLDLKGGSHLVYEADLSDIDKNDYGSAMQGLRDVIERRVNFYGIQEPLIQTQETGGHYRLVVELAGIQDIGEAKKMIGETPFLEFKETRSDQETKAILDKQQEIQGKGLEEAQQIADWQLALEDPYFKPTILTGKYLKKSEIGFDENTSKALILLQFNDEGAKLFEELTNNNIGKPLAISINGLIISAPMVSEKITGGNAQITGNFKVDEAKKLARELNAGALPVPISLVSEETVGPTLGQASLDKSLNAGAFGFLAVLLFLLLLYRAPGLIASFSLLTYGVLTLAFFKLVSATLSLSGIAGFILSVGMAVDANVLIFARIKEEIKNGKSFGLALEDGFFRAWPSIRDSNVTTMITSVILFAFGTSFVKGFAVTLILGIIGSLLASMLVTKSLLRVFSGTKAADSFLFFGKSKRS